MGKELENILGAIGRTPLIRLNKIAKDVGSKIYVKVESLNPGGSVKDRIGLAMIESAEKKKLLSPGGTIIEATAGNTGVGLAMAAAIKGYRMIFVLPDKMSEDKISLLRAYGAEIVIVPTSVAPDSIESYNGVADSLAKEIPGAYRPNQFENPNNPHAHYMTTGPEIWEDSGGNIDIFVAGMGTGGTISGVGKFLKEKNRDIIIVGADPQGSILSGDSPRSYMVEGIGEDFIPKTFNRQIVDEMIRVADKESFHTARDLARKEGILAGGSSGTAVAAAIKYAKRLSEPKYIVVLLPDTGRNYLSKIFSDTWMEKNGFCQGGQKDIVKAKELLENKKDYPAIISVSPQDLLKKALALMHQYHISQIPVLEENKVVGNLSESALINILHEEEEVLDKKISNFMGKPLPIVDENVELSEVYRIFLSATSGIILSRNKEPIAVLTRSDLIKYWTSVKERQ
jgi:cystathionine beta-synthase